MICYNHSPSTIATTIITWSIVVVVGGVVVGVVAVVIGVVGAIWDEHFSGLTNCIDCWLEE